MTADFEELVAGYRIQLHAYCYRMLGSVHDADDALQETLLAAWRGLDAFEGRSSLATWLYRIATNVCLRMAATSKRRATTMGPAWTDVSELGEPAGEPIWLEPYPSGNPECRYEKIENIGIAFTAALQHLPASQRAVLILREVLRFSAAETADLLGTSVAAVNSSLQRARKVIGDGLPGPTEQHDELVSAFVTAWERADVGAMVALLAKDARFSMPPLPAWFDGRDDVLRFMTERMWPDGPWRLVPVEAGGQPAFACYQRGRLGAVCVLTVRDGLISELTGFLDLAVHTRLGIRDEFDG